MEELEQRALPNASHGFAPIQHVAVDVRLDLKDIQADVQVVAKALGSSTSATVTADINALNTNLSTVLADLEAGQSPTSDLNATITAGAKLSADLGMSIPPALRNQVRDLGKDLADLSKDLGQITQDLRGEVTDIQADAQALAKALVSNTSMAVTSDLQALNTALSMVVADLSAGQSAANDLSKVLAAEAQLATDLGHDASRIIRHELSDLRKDVNHLTKDLGQITKVVNRNVADIQAGAQALAKALASNTSMAVADDLKALNTDLSAVASDLAAGGSAAGDLNKVIADVAKLTTDVGTNVSPVLQHQLSALRNALLDLAIEVAALKV